MILLRLNFGEVLPPTTAEFWVVLGAGKPLHLKSIKIGLS